VTKKKKKKKIEVQNVGVECDIGLQEEISLRE